MAGWADNVAATHRRLVKTNRRFMVVLSMGTNPRRKRMPPTQRLSHRKAVKRKPMRFTVSQMMANKRRIGPPGEGIIFGLEMVTSLTNETRYRPELSHSY
jgi:hypothetical protein